MKSFASICATLCAICTEATAASITTDAPGWVFRDTEPSVFRLGECLDKLECLEALDKLDNLGNLGRSWTLRDWRGRELASGEWPADGRLALAPLPPGYYSINGRGFMVVDASVPPNPDSFFAADSAFTMWAKRGEFDCPWHDGDSFRVVAELMGLCGVSHTRERMILGRMAPKRDVADFSPYLENARLMKRNGTQCLGLFGDTPEWMGRTASRRMPRDLMALYRFMEKAVVAFGECCDAWEFWNEQELNASSGPVWEYAAALKAFSLGAAAGDPAKTVLPGSMSAVDHQGFGEAMFRSDIAKYVDAFNLHTYVKPAGLDAFHADLRAFLEEAGVPGFQTWLTEYGTNLEGMGARESSRAGLRAHSPEQELLVAEVCAKGMILQQFGGIFLAWWFLFGCYNEQHGEKDWGTMRRDGSAKPVCAVLATLNRLLGGARLLGEVRVGEGVRAFLYETGDAGPEGPSQTLAFWRETEVDTGAKASDDSAPDIAFRVPAADGAYRIVDAMGTPASVVAAKGALALSAGRFPQFATGLRGLAADVPAADPGELGRKPPEPGEDLSVVLRPRLSEKDFDIGGRHCVAELRKPSGQMEIDVWNLAPESRSGHIEAVGGTLRAVPDAVELPPFGHVTVQAEYTPPEGKETEFLLELRFRRDDGLVSTRSAIPVFHYERFHSDCTAVPWTALDDPSAWTRNDSADSYRCSFDESESAVRFDVEWNPGTTRGAYFFPLRYLARGESLDGVRIIEFEVKTAQDKVENDFNEVVAMAVYRDGRVRYLPYQPPNRDWGVRRVSVPDDAKDIVAMRFGVTPRGRRLTYWIRNVRILRPRQ